jgi:hypothetical protein
LSLQILVLAGLPVLFNFDWQFSSKHELWNIPDLLFWSIQPLAMIHWLLVSVKVHVKALS